MNDKQKIKQLERIIPADFKVVNDEIIIRGVYLKDTLGLLYDSGICFIVEPDYIKFSIDELAWIDSDIKRTPPLVDYRLYGQIKHCNSMLSDERLFEFTLFILGFIVGLIVVVGVLG